MKERAVSVTPYATALLEGRLRTGQVGAHGYVFVDGDVLALTPPGALRMPNGIETAIRLTAGERVVIGEGALRCGRLAIVPGAGWDPKPWPRFVVSVAPVPPVDPLSLIGWGEGLTPLGDDVAIGYCAAAFLAGRRLALPHVQTTALSTALLRLAQEGALPEAAHRLLVNGDPAPLLAFGQTSGKGIVLGLALAPHPVVERRYGLALSLPLGEFTVSIGEAPC